MAPVGKIGRNVYYLVRDVLTNRTENTAARKHKADSAANQELARSEREEKLRLTKAQAEGQEIKNAQLREKLAPVELIEWVIGNVGEQVITIFDALPEQLKKRMPKLTDSNIETIRREIAKVHAIAAGMTLDLDQYYGRKQT